MPKTFNDHISKKHDWLLISIGVIVFIYIILRAIIVPLHYDELLNYFLYVETGDFQPFLSVPDANNHLISTGLNHLTFLIFGKSIHLMRASSVLAFVLYFIYLYKFSIHFKSKNVHRAFVITLGSGAFIISFFSIARGYALSLACIIPAIYYLFNHIKSPSWKTATGISLFSSLALWSNLSFFFFVFILLGCSLAISLLKIDKIRLKGFLTQALIILVLGATPLLIASLYLLHLEEAKALYLGSNANFWNTVINDLPGRIIQFEAFSTILFFASCATLIIAIAFNLKNYKQIKLISNSTLSIVMFSGVIVGSIALHLILGINYPQERAALAYIITGLLVFFILTDQLNNKWQIISYFPVSIFVIDLLLHINLSYIPCFKNHMWSDQHTEAILAIQKETDQPITISAPGYLGRIYDHYEYRTGIEIPAFQENNYPDYKVADIVVGDSSIHPPINEYEVLYSQPQTTVTVYHKKKEIDWKKVKTVELDNNSSFASSEPYINIDTNSFYKSSSNAHQIEFKISIESPKEPVNAWIVVAMDDEDGNFHQYEHIELNRFTKDYSKPKHIHKAFYFSPNELNCTYTFSIYIWNIDMIPLKIEVEEISYYESI
ncbi:hypothetical protein K6119_07485 [Paracrocinitomix mangrovi]|uniref:ArnT family glycosyltransferase n=1 Tax=Paracrocinitomix mangrovi TaxID=2862509 RepID=UPI001C8D84C5|nr:hypothetical protein [Paracrocinitomix mangrovi]UKN03356.1 hypothetical protein K6119_07485 [Paracrocinitomix mangrovi]